LSDFQFDGVGILPQPGKLKASIDDKTNHYYVSEGEYILGRYRINRVTETSVEIEDMEQNRRQTYTRISKI
jgi:Tfp pilus assembly protein PilP